MLNVQFSHRLYEITDVKCTMFSHRVCNITDVKCDFFCVFLFAFFFGNSIILIESKYWEQTLPIKVKIHKAETEKQQDKTKGTATGKKRTRKKQNKYSNKQRDNSTKAKP